MHEQSPSLKLLVVKKYKPCEIYRIMCDAYTEIYFSKYIVY